MIRLLIFGILLLFTVSTTAQRHRDQSYSVHNYKHPNKAAEAASNDYDHLNKFSYKEAKGTRHRNYKAQNHPPVQEGGIVPQEPIEKPTNSVFSKRNYKRQF